MAEERKIQGAAATETWGKDSENPIVERASIHGIPNRSRLGIAKFRRKFQPRGDQNKKNRGIPGKGSPGTARLEPHP